MSNTFASDVKNDCFAFLRGIDLQDLLVEVENNLIEYRYNLNLPDEVTFGVEIEYEKVSDVKIHQFIIKNSLIDWFSGYDKSLSSGGEVSSPIMNDKIKYWQELRSICEFLSFNGADTLHNAGGHVHVGAHILGEDVEAWKDFLRLYTAYESVLFRFAYGDKISARKKILKNALPIADFLYSNMSDIMNIKSVDFLSYLVPNVRYTALNFKNVEFFMLGNKLKKNTLEFRNPNGTTDAVVWQNNINTFTKMLLSSKNKVMDGDFLNYKLKEEYLLYSQNKYIYDEVNLKNALEFVDLVFDNNLDKMYFLKQYLKGFQDNYGIKTAVKAKQFVK